MPVSAEFPPALEKALEKEVESGRYTSKSEVIRDAVRRLVEHRNREEGVMSAEMEEKVREAREQKGEGGEQPVSDLLQD